MSQPRDVDAYIAALRRKNPLPEGVRFAIANGNFVPAERGGEPRPINAALAVLSEPSSSFAGVFTSNLLAGAPVMIGRERLRGPHLRAIIVNNSVANVGTETGVADANALIGAVAEAVGVPASEIIPASTGVIGWRLPVEPLAALAPDLTRTLGDATAVDFARAIMTTDRWPKVRSAVVGGARVLGIAKGAGMIEPNMATMLGFLFTDADVDRRILRTILSEAVGSSFNAISVDGDQSTSDMVIACATRAVGGVDRDQLSSAFQSVCRNLAQDIVRNGEGTAHLISVRVSGTERGLARGIGKAVVNSPLVKAAIYGNDPNVGRIVSAVGDFLGTTADAAPNLHRVSVSIGGTVVFVDGRFTLDAESERVLSTYLRAAAADPASRAPEHGRNVEIAIEFPGSHPEVAVFGSDLSYEYVRENADYRS